MATIIIKNSTGSGVIPSSLQQGELAVNTKDGRLFYGSGSGNVVKELSTGGSTFPYTGSAIISGSLTVTGSIRATAGITGSLQGTASWASNAVFANGATSANQIYIAENTSPGTYSIPVYPDGGFDGNNTLLNANISYEYATQALTVNNITASNGLFGTASWATNALTASFVNTLNQTVIITGSLQISGSVISNTDGLNRLARYGTSISGSTIGPNNTTQTISYSQLIPGNTFGVGNIIRIRYRFRKLSTSANSAFNILINSTNSVSGATQIAVFNSNTGYTQMKRDLMIHQGNFTSFLNSSTSTATDDAGQNLSSSTIDWSTDRYIIFTITLNNSAESGYGLGYSIEQVL